VLTADLSRLGQVRRLAAQVQDRYDRLDVLVNNAGVATFRPQLTPDGLGVTLATNHLGPFLLANLLLDQLRRSAPARGHCLLRPAQAAAVDSLGRPGTGTRLQL
jgi:NAD(P)-dependent dehydrogenase (short-subunit alcohol dehydrogenase family)